MADPVRIFVGADRSQLFAVRVLEHSIRRHTDLPVELTSMHDLALPEPRDPRNWARTGFSFARFAIPALCGHAGRAIYLDADMLVFGDVAELWHMPFDGAKVIVQEELTGGEGRPAKPGATRRRRKQCSVMVLDCGALDWRVEEVVAGLDGTYDYAALMEELCILDEAEISHALPFRWNSLEHYVASETRLLHYTDMGTQPWVSPDNPLGHLWTAELRAMLAAGAVDMSEIEAEIGNGYLRPSLRDELAEDVRDRPPPAEAVARYRDRDRAAGFVQHAELMAKLTRRKAEMHARTGAAGAMHALLDGLARGLRRLAG